MFPASFPLASRNFVELLQRRAELHGPAPACTFLSDGESSEETWSYAELDYRARTVAAWLQDLGAVGQPVLLVYPQGLDFIAAFFGCLYAGAIAVPAYPPRRNRRAQRICCMVSDANVALGLTTQELLDQLVRAISTNRCLSRPRWQATDRLDDAGRRVATAGYHRAFAGLAAIHVRVDRRSQGRDGHARQPAGEPATDHRIVSPVLSPSCCVGWLPLHHDMGLIGNLLHPLYHGGHFVFLVAGGIPAATHSLAAGDHAIPRDARRRAQLRL